MDEDGVQNECDRGSKIGDDVYQSNVVVAHVFDLQSSPDRLHSDWLR